MVKVWTIIFVLLGACTAGRAQADQELYPKRYSDGTYGYANSSGSFMITPKYHKAYPFQDGYARIQMYGNWGLIDRKGNLVVKAEYQYVGWSDDPFYNANKQWLSVANARRLSGRNFFAPSENKIGVIKDGKWYLKTLGRGGKSKPFDSLDHFAGGFAPVFSEEKSGWTFIDIAKAQMQTEEVFQQVFTLQCGLVGISKNEDEISVLDPQSEKIVAGPFLEVASLNEQIFAARAADGWGVVDRDGKQLSGLQYRKVTYLPYISKIRMTPKSEWQVLNRDLKTIHQGQPDTSYFRSNGDLVWKQAQSQTYFDTNFIELGTAKAGWEISRDPPFWLKRERARNYVCDAFPGGSTTCIPYTDLAGLPDNVLVQNDSLIWSHYDQELNFLRDLGSEVTWFDKNLCSIRSDSGYVLYHLSKGVISDSAYSRILSMSEGMIYVVKKGKKGLISSDGKIIIPPTTNYFRVVDENTIAFEDTRKLRLQFLDSAEDLTLAGRTLYKNGDSAFTLLLPRGQQLLDRSLEPYFREPAKWVSAIYGRGLVTIHSRKGWGVFDLTTRSYWIDPSHEYDSIGVGIEGLIPVEIHNNKGFLGQNGALVISTQYEDVKPPVEGLYPFKLKGRWGLFDKNEKILLQPRYDLVAYLGNGLWQIRKDEKVGLFKRGDGIILPPELDHIDLGPAGQWLIAIKSGKQGLFDLEGNQKLSSVYEQIIPVEGPSFLVQRDHDWDILDQDFKSIKPFKINHAATNSQGLFIVQKKEDPVFLEIPPN